MRKLKSLVPPLDLCRQIPPEAFDDSALVWLKQNEGNKHHPELWLVVERESTVDGETYFPAPTLAESMAALATFGNCFLRKDETDWMVMIEMPGDDEGYGYAAKVEHDKDDPATAALKLWLELNKK